jgi:hypothetical protein
VEIDKLEHKNQHICIERDLRKSGQVVERGTSPWPMTSGGPEPEVPLEKRPVVQVSILVALYTSFTKTESRRQV